MSSDMTGVNSKRILTDIYALIAELWCSPPEDDVQRQELKKDSVGRLESIDKESAKLLSRFLKENTILDMDYIDLFKSGPQCSLYLGSHSYEEPQTCANAAVFDVCQCCRVRQKWLHD